jgi:4-amino-4-deoxy-L-arabinose transferase-like glycosyltransferase
MVEDGGMVEVSSAERGGRRWVGVEWGFVVVVFVVAFVVRVWGVSRMHAWDENVYLLNAQQMCCGGSHYNEIDSRPPLLPLLFAGVFKVWHSDYAAYLLTAAMNALGVVFLYLAGRRYVGRRAAGIAAVLMGFTPFFVGVFPAASSGFVSFPTGHSLLSDCPALTLIVLAFWLLVRGVERDSAGEFGAAGVVLAMTVLMRFPSLASVGVLSLMTLGAKRRVRAMVACAVGFAVGIAPYLCWSRWRYGGFLATFVNGWENFSGPGQTVWFYMRWSGVIFGWVTLAGLALWVGQRVWAGWKGAGWGLGWREGFLCLWAVVLVGFFSALGHKEPRYVMPAAPPLFLLAGVGLSGLLRGRLRVWGAGVLVVAMGVAFWPDRARFATGFVDHAVSEEMDVAAYLNATVAPGTVIYANLGYPDLAYYGNFDVEALPEGGRELYDTLGELDRDGIFVAYTRYEPGVPPEPSIAWLEANRHFRRLKAFPTIVVYRFDKE